MTEDSNAHPLKVVIDKEATMYSNEHPYKVIVVGGSAGGEARIVDELPEEGEGGYIYLILKEETSEGNIYDEYMWVLQEDGETYGWEHIGATNEVKIEVDDALSTTSENPVQNKVITGALQEVAVTFKPFPEGVNTTGTTQQFISSIQALGAETGSAFLGTVELSDLPASLIQEEVQVYIYDNNLVYCVMYSADTEPYAWWCNSYDFRGWEPMNGTTYTAGANIQIANGVISATDTTYSAFVGTDGTTAGSQGLVPAPTTSDGNKYLKADGTWATVPSGITVVQNPGNSQADVMSQNAATKLVFQDTDRRFRVAIGDNITTSGDGCIAMGDHASATGGSIAMGRYSIASASGVFSLEKQNVSPSIVKGYNGSRNMVVRGVYDPQQNNDAATKGYVDTVVADSESKVINSTDWSNLWQ